MLRASCLTQDFLTLNAESIYLTCKMLSVFRVRKSFNMGSFLIVSNIENFPVNPLTEF